MTALALYPYQATAAQALGSASKSAFLAAKPGWGKSAMAITAARNRHVRRLMIVCPLSAVLVWQRELARWWPDHPRVVVAPFDDPGVALEAERLIVIVTYGLMSQRNHESVNALLAAPAMDMTVLDEAHYLKSSKSARAQTVLLRLRSKLGFVLPMSATPAPNNAGELWTLLRTLRPDLIRNHHNKAMSESEFLDAYCETRLIKVGYKRVSIIVGSKNVAALRARIKPFFVDIDAKAGLQLPPLRFDSLPVQVSREALADINDLEELDHLDDDDLLRFLAQGNVALATMVRALGVAKAPAVAEWVSDRLDNGEPRLVVWAIHHAVVDYLAIRLAEYGVVKLDGRDALADRAKAVDAWLTGKPRVFVGQIVTGGVSLTLIGPNAPCKLAVFAETRPVPSDNYQAACRIHRIGQRDAVLALFAQAHGTYDDRLEDILVRKARDFADLFE